MINKIYEIKEYATFCEKNKIFTYIKCRMPLGREFTYNGFVLNNTDDFLVLFDVIAKSEIPIQYETIIDIQPSKNNKVEADLVFEEWRNENGI